MMPLMVIYNQAEPYVLTYGAELKTARSSMPAVPPYLKAQSGEKAAKKEFFPKCSSILAAIS